MLAPSEILQPKVYGELDPEAIARYLVANSWRCIHEEDGRFLGMRWFYHALPPQWAERELITNRRIPLVLKERAAHTRGTLLSVGASRHREFPQMNRHTLLDLEIHQNRWIGFIIADIQAMEAALHAPTINMNDSLRP